MKNEYSRSHIEADLRVSGASASYISINYCWVPDFFHACISVAEFIECSITLRDQYFSFCKLFKFQKDTLLAQGLKYVQLYLLPTADKSAGIDAMSVLERIFDVVSDEDQNKTVEKKSSKKIQKDYTIKNPKKIQQKLEKMGISKHQSEACYKHLLEIFSTTRKRKAAQTGISSTSSSARKSLKWFILSSDCKHFQNPRVVIDPNLLDARQRTKLKMDLSVVSGIYSAAQVIENMGIIYDTPEKIQNMPENDRELLQDKYKSFLTDIKRFKGIYDETIG